ncbi:hypothetical protein B0A49_08236 [Cryomyces minteri]|uniref:Transmembrane protein 135 N-terminal domain-containing protein n=1 Tax=Cryomyces minteri TaxID=331657 RepID=A0A4U0X6V9_9PEZI|nr:hypothetical protein B0A49_08236 [Cryomyces minteri]
MSSHTLTPTPPKLAGKTMDLTLFALIRALDITIGTLWSSHLRRRHSTNSPTAIEALLTHMADPLLFATSSAIIMWSWFYAPHRLPRAYNAWISSAARVDGRLIEALRQARYGNFVYGRDTGQAPLLQAMCADYGWPLAWGDPAQTVPIPCEMVHMGAGPNCHYHAMVRFARSWLAAMKMYAPLNVVVLARLSRRRKLSLRDVAQRALDATRSAAFLAAFIALFYYGVCLSRTRLGPRLLSARAVTPMMWDSGLCVGAGCALCGAAVLVEQASRRTEIALFVAPRAAATVLPRRYDAQYRWREQAVFAISAAVVFTVARERPERVRGVLGGLLQGVLSTE